MKNLIQHKNSHKFSSDALLLADFTPLDKVTTFVELGTGCGIISLELLSKKTNIKALGIDICKELLDSAKENLELYKNNEDKQNTLTDFNFNNISFIQEDLNCCPNFSDEIILEFRNSTDLVVTNPPWLLENQGKLPTEKIKRQALFADKDVYKLFFKSAKFFLKEKGLLSFVTIPSRLNDALEALIQYGFSIKEIQFVHNSQDEDAIFMLCLAQFRGKQANSLELKILPPKFLNI